MTFSETLAEQVLELRAERARLLREVGRLRRSRDLWRRRYEYALASSVRHRNALKCVNYRERQKATAA